MKKISPSLTDFPPIVSVRRAQLSLASYYCSTPHYEYMSDIHISKYCTCHRIRCYLVVRYTNMAISSLIREQARRLRTSGGSLHEIAKKLSQSKSTVSYWCRDIELTDSQLLVLSEKQRDAGRIGRMIAAQQKHNQRIIATQMQCARGRDDVGVLSERDIFILGLALYWGEGYKRGNEECGITNTDPNIILSFIVWVHAVYGIQKDDLILRVSVNESHKDRTHQIEQYWSQLTGISKLQFTRTSLIKTPRKKTYSDSNSYVGTLRVKVRRATALRRRILGSIEEVGRQIQATKLNSRKTR